MDNEKVLSRSHIPASLGIRGASLLLKDPRGPIFKGCKCFIVEEGLEEDGTLHNASCSFPSPPVSLAKKDGAEFIGTLMLIFSGTATSIVNQKTNNLQVPAYIGAQVVASLGGIFHPIMGGGVTVPSGGIGQAFALDFVISFNLMFVVPAAATDTKAVGELAGITVGAPVMLNVLIAGEKSGASMNPLRTLGPAIVTHNYKAVWSSNQPPYCSFPQGAGTYSAVKMPEKLADSTS